MITGYNTDVRRGELVLHVQTEDKGLANPAIESVIYVAGQVVASRRSSYSNLIAEGKGEREVAVMMDHQHRTIVAAIRDGRFDDKLGALAPGRVPQPRPSARAAAAETAESGATLDQVILEYLSTEAESEQLVLVLEGGVAVVAGNHNLLRLRATSSKSGKPVPAAQVTVKILSTVSEPRVVSAGETDAEGRLAIAIDVPAFDRGTGALIISAISSLGRAELKSLL